MSKLILFPFGTITVRRPGFLESVMDEGIEIGEREAAEITSTLRDELAQPYVMLVDRRNRYSLTHAAMQAIAAQENLVAMAILVYDRISASVAEMEKLYGIPLEVFTDREDALAWLHQRQHQALGNAPRHLPESETSLRV